MRQQDNVLLKCEGFRIKPWSKVLYGVLTAISAGAFWLIGLANPQAALWLYTPCPLHQADYILATLIDGRKRLVEVQKTFLQTASAIKFGEKGSSFSGSARIQEIRHCIFFLQKYIYSAAKDDFVAVPSMPTHLPMQIRRALDTLQSIEQGADWKQFNKGHLEVRKGTAMVYGNKRLYKQYQLILAALTHAAMPMFLLQYIECIYLVIRGYWIFPVLAATLSLLVNTTLLTSIYKQHWMMLGLVQHARLLPLVHLGWVRAVPAHVVVPGDVVVLQRGKITADMVLLRGSCLVEESMLSGEPAMLPACLLSSVHQAAFISGNVLSAKASQVRKSCYTFDEGVQYNPDAYHNCTIYAGTVVNQVWNADDPEDEVLAMVVRTGLNTCMGSMVRQMIAPTRLQKEATPFVADLFKFFGFALAFAMLLFAAYAARARHFHQNAQDVIYTFLDMCCHAAPIGAPAVMLLIGGGSVGRLAQQGIDLKHPEACKLASACDVVCFDKTGTLTGSRADLHGVVPVQQQAFETLQTRATLWSNKLIQAAAVCNGLTMVNRTTVVGDSTERSLFKAVEACFLDRRTVSCPLKSATGSSDMVRLSILKTLEFNPQTLKSGVVVRSGQCSTQEALLFMRGAPMAIKTTGMGILASVPADYDEVVDDYSSMGYRVLAMAVGTLPQLKDADLPQLSQQQLEMQCSQIELLALVVLTDHLRPDSRETVSQLQKGGNIRTIMITGDYHHTAISVARNVGMLDKADPIVVIDVPQTLTPAQEAGQNNNPLTPSGQRRHLQPLQSILKSNVRVAHSLDAVPLASPAATPRQRVTYAAWESYSDDTSFSISRAQSAVQSSVLSLASRNASMQIEADDASVLFGQVQPVKQQSSTLSSSAQRQSLISVTSVHHVLEDMESTAARVSVFNTSTQKQPQSAAIAITTASQLSHSQSILEEGSMYNSFSQKQPTTIKPMSTVFQFAQQLDGTGLKFSPEFGGPAWDCASALTALAEGQARCAVTGDAFEHLLHCDDAFTLQTIMRNVVVFARMQTHQKGQVMDLLTIRGLYQMHKGQVRHIEGMQHTVMFAGDGINDLAALSAADIGFAISAAEANAAADIATAHPSVSGLVIFIKDAKCVHGLIVAMFKIATCKPAHVLQYMVTYQLITALGKTAAFCMSGHSFSFIQAGGLDVMAMTVAASAALSKPLHIMTVSKPSQIVNDTKGRTLLTNVIVFHAVTMVVGMLLLSKQSWYQGESYPSRQNPANTVAWLLAALQVLTAPVSLLIDTAHFMQPLIRGTTVKLEAVWVLLVVLGVAFGPVRKANIFHLYMLPKPFRLELLALAVIVAVLLTAMSVLTRVIIRRRQDCRVCPA